MVLSNSQYDEIMHEYNRKQFAVKNETDRRTAEVLLAVPQYKNCLDEISEISVAAAKANLRGDNSLSMTLSDRIRTIEETMRKLLLDAGYSADYLNPVYFCPDCKDTGYVGNEKCHCFKQAEIDLLYRQSNIKEIVSRENFSTFSYEYYSDQYTDSTTGLTPRDNMKKVVSLCKDFVKNFPCGENLLFYGAAGVGKTFLSNCIAKELLDTSNSVLYLSAIDLFEYFSKKNDYFENSSIDNSYSSMQIIECDLLIIDDLGTELVNAFTNSKLFYCINERLLLNKSTIISTNHSLQELISTYSERIFSRISSSYKLIKLFGDDIRIIKQ